MMNVNGGAVIKNILNYAMNPHVLLVNLRRNGKQNGARMMFGRKKYNGDEKDMSLKELLEEYTKDYYVSVEYKANGVVCVFVGTSRNPEEK